MCLPRHTSFPDVQSALRSVVPIMLPSEEGGRSGRLMGDAEELIQAKLLDKYLAVLAIITVAW